MGVITLTDRISVTVRAKSNTGGTGGGGASAQELATGRNAAKALGADPESISDEEAEALFDILNGGDGTGSSGASGSGTSKAITDEQGRQWLPISGVIAAGKRMYANGVFDEKEVHEGLTDSDGTVYGGGSFGPVYSNDVVYTVEHLKSNGESYDPPRYGSFGGAGGYFTYDDRYTNNHIQRQVFSKERNAEAQTAWSVTINGVRYSFFWNSRNHDNIFGPECARIGLSPGRFTMQDAAAYLFGPSHTTGGSLIDWTKPDDEIEDDIRNLHNTWDVTEHEGSATANGTYILAGPIEYNDADPSSPDPDEEE